MPQRLQEFTACSNQFSFVVISAQTDISVWIDFTNSRTGINQLQITPSIHGGNTMDQSAIGKYIYQKRKAKNLTQTQLAEKLGVSNKTISKWENGKCMPDYSIIENLCNTLGITISEFIDAEDAADDSIRMYDEKQITDLLRRTQELESQKATMYGMFLIVIGIAMLLMSHTVGGSDMKDFMSGVLFGISVGEILVGVYCIGRSFLRK